jgi:tetratricopeptide (TPR) repeat protein
LEAITHLKTRNVSGVKQLLGPLCPGSLQDAAKRTKKQDLPCMLIVFAESEYREARPPDRRSLLYWSAADIARRKGEPLVAKGLYEVAIDRYAMEPENWYWLGIVERELGNLAASNTALRKTLELRPNDRDSLYWVATNLMDERRFEESNVILTQLVERNPTDGGVWYRRGQLLQRTGNCPQAVELFEKAKSLGVDKKMIKARIEECTDHPDSSRRGRH